MDPKELIALIHQSRLETWNHVYTLWGMELFGPKWIAVVIFMGIVYAGWWMLVDKRRLSHLLLFGSLMAVMRVIYEDTFVGMGAWTYQVRVFPMVVSLFLPDLTVVPLIFMLIYQYTTSWNSFFAWSALFSGIWAFAILPLFAAFDIVVFHNWKYYYSFIAALSFGVLSRFFFLLIMKVEQGYSVRHTVSKVSKTVLQPVMKPLENNDQQDKE